MLFVAKSLAEFYGRFCARKVDFEELTSEAGILEEKCPKSLPEASLRPLVKQIQSRFQTTLISLQFISCETPPATKIDKDRERRKGQKF